MTARIPATYGLLFTLGAFAFVSWPLLAAGCVCYGIALSISRRVLLPFGVAGRFGAAGAAPTARVPAEPMSRSAARRVDTKADR